MIELCMDEQAASLKLPSVEDEVMKRPMSDPELRDSPWLK